MHPRVVCAPRGHTARDPRQQSRWCVSQGTTAPSPQQVRLCHALRGRLTLRVALSTSRTALLALAGATAAPLAAGTRPERVTRATTAPRAQTPARLTPATPTQELVVCVNLATSAQEAACLKHPVPRARTTRRKAKAGACHAKPGITARSEPSLSAPTRASLGFTALRQRPRRMRTRVHRARSAAALAARPLRIVSHALPAKSAPTGDWWRLTACALQAGFALLVHKVHVQLQSTTPRQQCAKAVASARWVRSALPGCPRQYHAQAAATAAPMAWLNPAASVRQGLHVAMRVLYLTLRHHCVHVVPSAQKVRPRLCCAQSARSQTKQASQACTGTETRRERSPLRAPAQLLPLRVPSAALENTVALKA